MGWNKEGYGHRLGTRQGMIVTLEDGFVRAPHVGDTACPTAREMEHHHHRWPRPEIRQENPEWSNWNQPPPEDHPIIPSLRELFAQGVMPFALEGFNRQPLKYYLIRWPDGTTSAGLQDAPGADYYFTLSQMSDGSLRWNSPDGIDNIPFNLYHGTTRFKDAYRNTMKDAQVGTDYINIPQYPPEEIALPLDLGEVVETPEWPLPEEEVTDVPPRSHSVSPAPGWEEPPITQPEVDPDREDPNIRYIYDPEEAAELEPIDFEKVSLAEVVDDGAGEDPDEGMVSDTLGFEK